ncbi:MAG TPA: sulfite exporter TauE/SafE family protein [Phycisphaerales bacterium]|nr:sulfite exporter TauE/SafE family protein [Phycisphaerales bacterium]
MIALFLAVLTASLLGSLHCAGMCGAFVVLAVSRTDAGDGQVTRPWKLQAAYHAGRLTTYLVLGLVAGAIGASLNIGGSLVSVQRAATMLAAATLVVFGVLTLLRVIGVRKGSLAAPAWMALMAQKGHRAAWALDPLPRAAAIGLLTTLLPCGWLYAFVVTAAGTGHALTGTAVMAAFWLGTLPVMAAVGIGARRIAGPLGAYAPVLMASLLIAVGLVTLAHRATLIGLPLPTASLASARAEPSVPSPHAPLPCCNDH